MTTRHILSADQFDQELLFKLFKKAELYRQNIRGGRDLGLQGKRMMSLFYEVSTRTRISFESAALELGMTVTMTEAAAQFSSAAKGETLEDTIHVLCEYFPATIILRHPEIGAAKRAALVAERYGVPIINAGDGKGEHPSQALLDLYTIHRKFGRLTNLVVALGGDLANGRTGKSLCRLLSKFEDNRFIFIAPSNLQMDTEITSLLDQKGLHWKAADCLLELSEADVIYWTRVQKERMSDEDIEKLGDKAPFQITPEIMHTVKKDAILMHPLPRVDEILSSVDSDPRAVYFEQAGNGMFARMALLDYILN